MVDLASSIEALPLAQIVPGYALRRSLVLILGDTGVLLDGIRSICFRLLFELLCALQMSIDSVAASTYVVGLARLG